MSKESGGAPGGGGNHNGGANKGGANSGSSSKGGGGSSKGSGKNDSKSSGNSKSGSGSTMSEAAQRGAYSAGRATAQAMASGNAKASGGNLSPNGNQGGKGDIASRVSSINKALNSYSSASGNGSSKAGQSLTQQGANANMTEAQQRAAYSAGAAIARDHGVLSNLMSRVNQGIATKDERSKLDRIESAATRHSTATVVGGTPLGSLGSYIGNGFASLIDGDDYASQLGKRIGTGEMKGVLGSINDRFGQGGMADTALGVAASAASAVVPGASLVFNAISNGLRAPNASAIAEMRKALGKPVGVGDVNSNGSGKGDTTSAPPRYSLPNNNDLDKSMAGDFNFNPSRFDVTPGIRAQYAWDGE
ncbi:TPA: hypothetical protein P2I16_000159 [Aeromonas salmonicida]|nr:hypothetical protein [Aeromonas salmonicida]